MKAQPLIYCVFLAAMFSCGYEASRDVGRADARQDLSKGVLAMETWGLGGKYNQEYFRLLHERYGIRVSETGCLVDKRILEHAEGYNEIMIAEIEHRFGTNFWREVMADAKKIYETKLSQTEGQK